MKVLIYAPVDVFYYSFYIEGFYNIFGKQNVGFSVKEFPRFNSRTLAAIVYQKDVKIKIIIDALDTSRIYNEPLQWADVYGKVNLDKKEISTEQNHKILAIGPSFGIRIWSFAETLIFAISNYQRSKGRIFNKRYFFTSYWRQFKRLTINDYYTSSSPVDNYIFFVSSLWEKEEKTNILRAKFIETCKELKQVAFQGGFAPRSDKKDFNFSELIDERISLSEYLIKIKRSFVVFSTPAVQNCHGWKLAEFLALGKAIISTEIMNFLPEPLEDKKHLHFVSSSKVEIEKAVMEIMQYQDYRKQLEKNSRAYYKNNLAPEIVINRLLQYSNHTSR